MREPDWKIAGTIAHAQRTALLAALEACNYNTTKAAKLLRVGRSTTYRMLATYEVVIPARARTSECAVAKQPTVRDGEKVKKIVKRGSSRIMIRNGEYLLVRD